MFTLDRKSRGGASVLAYTATQALFAGGGEVNMQFKTPAYDTNGGWNPLAQEWVAPSSGDFLVVLQTSASTNPTVSQTLTIQPYVNGAFQVPAFQEVITPPTTSISIHLAAFVSAVKGDRISLKVTLTGDGDVTLLQGDPAPRWMAITQLDGPPVSKPGAPGPK